MPEKNINNCLSPGLCLKAEAAASQQRSKRSKKCLKTSAHSAACGKSSLTHLRTRPPVLSSAARAHTQ